MPAPSRGNEANEGGGIFHTTTFTNSVLILTNGTQVTGNTAVVGGGLKHDSDALDVETRVENSTLRENMAVFGGGIFSIGGLLDIRGSSIDNNDAANGGGIMAVSCDVSLSDDGVVLANTATGSGGGLYLGGSLTVTGTFCMILGNFADADEDGVGEGGGIFNDGGDISGVPMARVCLNDPDDIAEP